MGVREHRLIDRTDDYEIYEITWPPGHGLDWHTHGASSASVVVISGEITEWLRGESNTPPTKIVHKPGAVFHRNAYTAHKVVNMSRRTVRTLHTYAPPLTITYTEEQEIY